MSDLPAPTRAGSALFISHGGGPMPLLGDPGHAEMIAGLQLLARQLPRPDAIVVISAHWEAAQATLTSGAHPALIYDYYGFPAESYRLRYPAPGAPALAARIAALLADAGIAAGLDRERGFDHGLFVPLTLMWPEADIPCLQLSLLSDLDPTRHLDMGRALAPLLRENILLLGSGFSFHNLPAFFAAPTAAGQQLNTEFEQWLHHTCTSPDLTETARTRRLQQWADAPGARYCHPREEHLLPLHVCYGAAASAARASQTFSVLGKRASLYWW